MKIKQAKQTRHRVTLHYWAVIQGRSPADCVKNDIMNHFKNRRFVKLDGLSLEKQDYDREKGLLEYRFEAVFHVTVSPSRIKTDEGRIEAAQRMADNLICKLNLGNTKVKSFEYDYAGYVEVI